MTLLKRVRDFPVTAPVVIPRRGRNNTRAFNHSETTYWNGVRRFWDKAWTNRRSGQLVGSHVLDRADLHKAIMLCQTCVKKFNHITAGYVIKPNLPFCRGQCDGCLQFFPRLRLMVHHTIVSNL